jgi:hypothetical protein
MHISLDDAAAMCAKGCCAWYGSQAIRIVNAKAKQLTKLGDASGAAA